MSPSSKGAQAAPIANKIKATSFKCLEESSEWSDSDEVYWLFGSVAKGFKMTNGTHTYNGVDAGETWNLQDDEGCFWGMDCQPHAFPEGDIGVAVTLVEHDEGDHYAYGPGVVGGPAGAGPMLESAVRELERVSDGSPYPRPAP